MRRKTRAGRRRKTRVDRARCSSDRIIARQGAGSAVEEFESEREGGGRVGHAGGCRESASGGFASDDGARRADSALSEEMTRDEGRGLSRCVQDYEGLLQKFGAERVRTRRSRRLVSPVRRRCRLHGIETDRRVHDVQLLHASHRSYRE